MSSERTTRFGNSGEGNYESPGSLHFRHHNTAISALVLLVVYLLSTIGAFALPGDGHLTKMGLTAPGSTNAFLAIPHGGMTTSGEDLFGDFTPQPTSSHSNGFLTAKCAFYCPCSNNKYHCKQLLLLLLQAMPLIAASPKGISAEIFSDAGQGSISWGQMKTIRGPVEWPTIYSSQQSQINEGNRN